MSQALKHAEHIKKHAHPKLRLNLRILFVVYIILFGVTAYQLVVADAIFWQVVVAALIGFVAGMISTRMYKISWNKDEAKVIGRIDIYGVIVLVLFVVFELNRGAIAGLFADSNSVSAIGFVLITSALFGRIAGTSKKILSVLEQEGLR